MSVGGVSLALGETDATPAFDLTNATNYPTSSLTGTLPIGNGGTNATTAVGALASLGAAPALVRLTASLDPLVVGTTYIIPVLGQMALTYTLPTSTTDNEVIIIYCYDFL